MIAGWCVYSLLVSGCVPEIPFGALKEATDITSLHCALEVHFMTVINFYC